MKKFYKSPMYVSCIIGIIVAGVGALIATLATHDPVVRGVGRDTVIGSGFFFVFWVLLGFFNFLGSRFTLGPKWDFVTGSLPVFMLLPAMLVGIGSVVGAIILGSQSSWVVTELFIGAGFLVGLVFAGAFLRGMADDDRQYRELMAENRRHQG